MAQGKVEICGVNTAKLPILNEEEKEALFVRIKAGDAQAKEEYINLTAQVTTGLSDIYYDLSLIHISAPTRRS